MYWDRCDICEAYFLLECDWNVSGILRERPSNRRRNESIGCQLDRIRFRPSPLLSYDRLSENGREIYDTAVERFNLSK